MTTQNVDGVIVTTEHVPQQGGVPARRSAMISDVMTCEDVSQQVKLIQDVMHTVMMPDEHYGLIPGVKKQSLFKAGAEKLCLVFRLDPQYDAKCEVDGEHRTYTVTCTLYHINSGLRMGSGVGLCSTKESKYAWRKGERTCPHCGKAAIIKGRQEYGGGWLCWNKNGGCGAKFRDGEKAIEGQATGREPNPDLADTYNTVLKMGCKRALVAATLNATAASDIFTQDVEDMPQFVREVEAEHQPPPVVEPEPGSRATPAAAEPTPTAPPREAADPGAPKGDLTQLQLGALIEHFAPVKFGKAPNPVHTALKQGLAERTGERITGADFWGRVSKRDEAQRALDRLYAIADKLQAADKAPPWVETEGRAADLIAKLFAD